MCALTALLLSFVLGSSAPVREAAAPDPLASVQPYLVAISVSDVDASVGWYERVLGFHQVKSIALPKLALRIAFLERSGFRLELVELKASVSMQQIQSQFQGVDDRAKVQGYTKLAFAVDDIERTAALLKERKAHFVRDVTPDADTGQRWLIITDNAGNWLQFFERVPARR